MGRKRQNPVILKKKEYLRKRKGGTEERKAEMKSLARDHLMSGKAKNTKEKRSRTLLMNQTVKKSIQRKRKQRNQKLIQKVKASLMTSRKKSPRKENLKAIDLLKLLRKSLVAMNQLREKKRAKKKGELSEGSLHPQKNKDARRVKKIR